MKLDSYSMNSINPLTGKIISRQESTQILRNLYKKEAMAKYAQQLRDADPEERKILLCKIDEEIEYRVRQQVITGD